MAHRPRFERGRRLHSIRYGNPNSKRDRGGKAAAVCGNDAGEGRIGPDRAAAVLYVSADQGWGPARLWVTKPIHPGQHHELIRPSELARPEPRHESPSKEKR